MTQERQLDYARDHHVTLPVEFSGLGDRASAPRVVTVRSVEPASVEIAFERGTPTGINGVTMPLLDLLGSLQIIAGAHGVTNLAALHASHDALERSAVTTRGEFSSPEVAELYLRVLRDGGWFTPARQALDTGADRVQQRVTGVVRLTLFQRDCAVGDVRVSSRPKRIALAKADHR
jgi:argininosuccinate synthase